MICMTSVGKSNVMPRTFRTKFLAVFMSAVLVLSMVNFSAFATGDGSVTNETESATTLAQAQDSNISLELQNSYVVVNGQSYAGTKLSVPAGTDLIFTPQADAGYLLSEVNVSSASYATVPVEQEGSNYIIRSVYVDDSVVVKVATTVDPAASEENHAATPIDEADNGVIEGNEGSANEGSEVEVSTFGSPEVPTLGSDLEANGSKELKVDITDQKNGVVDGSSIKVTSGEGIEAAMSIKSSGLDAVIVAIPKNPNAKISMISSIGDVYTGTASLADLKEAGLTGLNESFSEYYIFVSDRRAADGEEMVQWPRFTFDFINGSTPKDATQPIEAYVIEGVFDSANKVIDGCDVAIAKNATATKSVAGLSPMKAETETFELEKTVTGVADGGLSDATTGTALISRPYKDSTSDYTIAYEIKLSSDFSGQNIGRLGITNNEFWIHDKLDNFLTAGAPKSVTVKQGSTTVTSELVASTGTSQEIKFKAILDANGYVLNNTYTVLVTYEKDAYTNMYPQDENPEVLKSRQIVTNSAWMNASTEAGTTIDTSSNPSKATNAIGYNQASPSDIGLAIQKQVLVKGTTSNYGVTEQLKFPEVRDGEGSEDVKVTFTLTPKSGEGTTVLSGKIDGNGVAIISGLVPNTTYTLAESQGIENFDSITPVEVKTGALDSATKSFTITIAGQEYGGTADTAYDAVNEALYDGTVNVNVKKQVIGLTENDLGAYNNAKDITVVLYEKGDDGEPIEASAMTLTTNGLGNVAFENINPKKNYIVKATNTFTGMTVNEVEIKSSDFTTGNNNTCSAELKYTASYGALKIAKNFVGADGSIVTSGLSASFTLVNNDDSSKTYPINLAAGTEKTAAELYNLAIDPGTYTLIENQVTGTNGGQYPIPVDGEGNTVPTATNIVVTAGEFDAYNTVLTNRSSYGQLKIQNFDYSNTALNDGVFVYTVSSSDPEAADFDVTIPAGKADVTIDVPAGFTYTVTPKTVPTGFASVAQSGAIAVAANTAATNATVNGVAPSFTVTAGTQSVGFVYASLPSAKATKVNVQGTTEEGSSETTYEGLGGAKFDLYKLNSDGVTYDKVAGKTVTSNANGSFTISNLEAGTYRLVETVAPANYDLPAYSKDPLAIDFSKAPSIVVSNADYTVSTAKNELTVSTSGVENAAGLESGMIPNTPFATPKIKLVSAGSGDEVKGGEFELRDSSGTVIATAKAGTDESGYISFKKDGKDVKLAPGTYTITQTATGSNYVSRPDAQVTLVVDSKGLMNASFDDTSSVEGGKFAHSKTEGGEITFSNVSKPEINITKFGDTNVFDESGKRVEKMISGAVFEFYEGSEGVVVNGDGKQTGTDATASQQTTDRGKTKIWGLDPDATYTVKEISAPDIEGTPLGRVPEATNPTVNFEYSKNENGNITGYRIVGQTAETALPIAVKGDTLTFHNPAEKTYQIDVAKFGLGTGSGRVDIATQTPETVAKAKNDGDEYAQGLFDDGVNAKFLVQKKIGDVWVSIETITTGTSSIDGSVLNHALSSELTAGTYRLVEIQSGIYSPDMGTNSLYEYVGSGTPTADSGKTDFTDWVESNASLQTFKDADGEDVQGLLWGEEIVLGGTGYTGNDPYDVVMGNDDERSTGNPWLPDYVVRLHGVKKAFNASLDKIVGDVGSVEFEVYFGWATKKEDGTYELIEGQTLQELSNVVSGSVKNEKGGFITEYITFREWTGGTNYDDINKPTDAVPCFVLKELGPVPIHLVQPTDETNTTILPFEVPGSGNYTTINAEDILTPQKVTTGPAVILNYEAEGTLKLTKYSAEDKDKDKDERGKSIKEGIFNVYRVERDGEGVIVKTTLAAVIDLATQTEAIELLRGEYYISEVTAPESFNPNGWYNDGGMHEFNGTTGYFKIGEDEDKKITFFDTAFASIDVKNYWDSATAADKSATYTIELTSATVDARARYDNATHLDGTPTADLATTGFTVSGANAVTLKNLPDGTYTIKQLSISDTSGYYANEKASSNGIRVVIYRGQIIESGVMVADITGLLWAEANGFDSNTETAPSKDNVRKEENNKGVGINHMPKSKLAIKMAYIDEEGKTQDTKHNIAAAEFEITKVGASTSQTVTWVTGSGSANLLEVPLDAGIYKVVQKSVTDGTTYSKHGVAVWVKIGKSHSVTFLQNNEDGTRPGVAKSTEAAPLEAGTANADKFFYNTINAGKLVITKVDSTNGNKLDNAEFTVTGPNSYDQKATAGAKGTGTHTINSVPAAPGGTNYTVTETVTPTGYYVDDSGITKEILPNQVNTMTVKNVPFLSIDVHKDAVMPSYLDPEEGLQQGAEHEVEGLVIYLYKDGVKVDEKETNVNGNCTFTGLDAGEYRIEEQDNLSYLDVDANTTFNSSNTSTHFTVNYTKNVDSDLRSVAIDGTPLDTAYLKPTEVDNALVTIRNDYNDDALLIPVKKVDKDDDQILVEGAVFRLTDADGNSLYSADNKQVIYAVTNWKGVGYFHFHPDKVYSGSNPADIYEGDYYVREINSTDAYVISPYKSEYLKVAEFDDGEKSAAMIVFENEKKIPAPALDVTKSTSTQPTKTLMEEGFDAEYTITPSVTEASAGSNPMIDYKVIDKGFVFKDDKGVAIVDNRLTYTITTLKVAKTVSGDGDPIYASVDGGLTWKNVSGDDGATFDLNVSGEATNPATSLFEVWYKTGEKSTEYILEKGFTPGEITLNVSFDKHVQASDAATANNVKTIVNTVYTTAKYPNSEEKDGLSPIKSGDKSATITLPDLPTLKIEKKLISNEEDVKRGAVVTYEVKLTNDSARDVVNPTIIDRPEPITYGSQVDHSVKIDKTLKKVTVGGAETTLVEGEDYTAISYDGGTAVAWVFKESLAAGSSIAIQFEATIDTVVMADDITNTAYGTSLPNYADLSEAAACFAKDNAEGALFKPASDATKATNYDEVSGVTGLNGGVYVTDSVKNKLEISQSAQPMKRVSTDGVNWETSISIEPGNTYYYKLQLYYDNEEGAAPLKNINMYELIPQNGTLGTGWTSDLIDLLRFSDLKVSGYDMSDDYQNDLTGLYEVYYSDATTYAGVDGISTSTASADNFKSFRVKMDDSYVMNAKRVLTVTYKVEVPAITDPVSNELTEFSYDDLEDNARQNGVSNFRANYKMLSFEETQTSKTVSVRIDAPDTDLVGTVWDDQNRNGALEDPETDPAYTRDTLTEEDVTVVLYKTDENGDFQEYDTTQLIGGSYSFSNLESSYGKGGPAYKVEFIYAQGSATYERPSTHQFSADQAATFANDGSAAGVSNVINKGINDDGSAIVGNSGEIRLLHGTAGSNNANVVNAGINAIPYNVTYNYGTAPSGASVLPDSEIHIYDDEVTVAAPATAPGYDFIGWSHDDFDMPPSDVEITGVWVARGDTPYIVEYYFQDIGGAGYTIDDAETMYLTGETDTTAYALIKSFTGFTHNPDAPGTLLEDNIDGRGTTVLKVYYDRNMYTVDYAYVGTVPNGAAALPVSVDYWYGDDVTVASVPSLAGYTFHGWSHTDFTMPANNVTITGTWVANGNTPYIVEYYLQDIGGGSYTRVDGETIYGSGVTDTTVNALIKNFGGFTHNPAVAGTLLSDIIRGDGSTVLRVYYDRNMYAVNYIYTGVIPTNAPATPATVSYWYGQAVTIADNPTLDGYTFSGWDPSRNFTMPANNVTVQGSWTIVNVPGPTTDGGTITPIVTPTTSAIVGALTAVITEALAPSQEFADDGTPLARGYSTVFCWVHWYILLGIIVTAAYSAIVIARRRKFDRGLKDYEDDVMGNDESADSAAQGFNNPATQGMGA